MSQLAPRSESFGAGDLSWLGSRHGSDVAKSATGTPDAWTAKIVDGVVRSGEAFAQVDGLAVPYDSEGSDGANVLAGFVLTDQAVDPARGNFTFPGVWHGRILLSKLPSPVDADATTSGLFTLEA